MLKFIEAKFPAAQILTQNRRKKANIPSARPIRTESQSCWETVFGVHTTRVDALFLFLAGM